MSAPDDAGMLFTLKAR